MASISLKNVPDDLYESLKASAASNHRSINGEVISLLRQGLAPTRRTAAEIIETARALRAEFRGGPIDEDELDRFKREGRA